MAEEMSQFMQEYGLTNFDMYAKDRVIGKVGKGIVPEVELMKKVDKYTDFFQTKFSDYEKKVRISMGIFYVADNIPEL